MRVAVVGASGMVGRMFLKVLEEKKLNVDEYVLFSSSNIIFICNVKCN